MNPLICGIDTEDVTINLVFFVSSTPKHYYHATLRKYPVILHLVINNEQPVYTITRHVVITNTPPMSLRRHRIAYGVYASPCH